ncbi:MAG: glycosyltransferase [Cycloclasticus sp.]
MPSKAPLKVLLLSSSYPRNKTDNSSIFLRYLAKNLVKHGVDIHVLAPDHSAVEKQQLDTGVKTHWFKYLPRSWQALAYGSGILPNLKKNPLLYLQVPFFLISMFFYLLYLCKKLKPDVIHAHWIIPQGFIAVLVGKLFNIPVITTAHGGDAFSLNNNLLSRLKRFTIQHCQAWTSNTSATAQTFNSTTKSPSIIPMGVDIEHFQAGLAENTRGKETRNIILFVGRLVEKKGVKYLIEAFSQLPAKTQQESVLWIIGDGDERVALERQAKELGLSNIEFWGQVPNDQLPHYYAAASIFVAPSIIDSKGDTEGQGVILLEAMASNTPIISTNVGGIPEVVSDNKTGLLVRPNNPAKLSLAILNLLSDGGLAKRLALNAQLSVKKNYAWQSIAQQFITLFKQYKPNNHRDGFSSTTNRRSKAEKILTILGEELGTAIENKHILDIGTGSGDIAAHLGEKNNVISVDISDFRQQTKNYSFSLSNESLPFTSNCFDIVISNHVIEHVQDQQIHIDEIKRVLKSQGILYLATPNRIWPFEVHYRVYLLHYLPHKIFINILKHLKLYKEDVNLLGLSRIKNLLAQKKLNSYSGRIIKKPSSYLMRVPPWLEKTLNRIPMSVLNKTTFIHPTFILIFKKT